jgi:hypothetical protein
MELRFNSIKSSDMSCLHLDLETLKSLVVMTDQWTAV